MSMAPTPPPAKQPRDYFGCLLPLAMLGLAVAWLTIGYGTMLLAPWVKAELPGATLAETGTLGDTFVAANALFAALGVGGVVYTLLLQHRELREARKDSAESKEMAVIAALINAHSTLARLHFDRFNASRELILKAAQFGSDFTELQKTMDVNTKESRTMEIEVGEVLKLVAYAEWLIDWEPFLNSPECRRIYGEMNYGPTVSPPPASGDPPPAGR